MEMDSYYAINKGVYPRKEILMTVLRDTRTGLYLCNIALSKYKYIYIHVLVTYLTNFAIFQHQNNAMNVCKCCCNQ
jgi:hypothetical protein